MGLPVIIVWQMAWCGGMDESRFTLRMSLNNDTMWVLWQRLAHHSVFWIASVPIVVHFRVSRWVRRG